MFPRTPCHHYFPRFYSNTVKIPNTGPTQYRAILLPPERHSIVGFYCTYTSYESQNREGCKAVHLLGPVTYLGLDKYYRKSIISIIAVVINYSYVNYMEIISFCQHIYYIPYHKMLLQPISLRFTSTRNKIFSCFRR